MIVRMVSRIHPKKPPVPGRVIRVTPMNAHLQVGALYHKVVRRTGKGPVARGVYDVHPDDVALLTSPEADALEAKTRLAQQPGVPTHWGV